MVSVVKPNKTAYGLNYAQKNGTCLKLSENMYYKLNEMVWKIVLLVELVDKTWASAKKTSKDFLNKFEKKIPAWLFKIVQ